MRWRLFFATLAISVLAVGATWLTMQPMLARAAKGAEWHQANTLVLTLDLAVGALLVFLILNVFVGRAVERTEAAALKRWEPGFRLKTIRLTRGGADGVFVFEITGIFYPRGHLGDYSVLEERSAVIASNDNGLVRVAA